MTEDRLNELLEKANSDNLSPEEELELLKEMNQGVEELRALIAELPDASEDEHSE